MDNQFANINNNMNNNQMGNVNNQIGGMNNNNPQLNREQMMGYDAFPKRDYAPSDYVIDKFSQYKINADNISPQITDMPFFGDVYYSMPDSLGTPIYVNPSYNTFGNASFLTKPYSEHQNVPSPGQPIQQVPRQNDMFMLNGNMESDFSNMERSSYFNTMNAHNKDVNYKDFKEPQPKKKEPKIKYVSRNKDNVNTAVILLLLGLLILNYRK